MCSTRPFHFIRHAVIWSAIGLLTACTDGGGASSSDIVAKAPFGVSGSVGDGPVTGAEITVTDAEGAVVLEETSDLFANYSLEIPEGTPLPVRITARGGTDLVTGRPLDFDLVAVSNGSGSQTVNVSPLSTLALAQLDCRSDRVTAAGVRDSWQRIETGLGFGLDLPDPMWEGVTVDSVATFVLANEALGELVRRTTATLANAGVNETADAVLEQLACDLAADGELNEDGSNARTTVALKGHQAAIAVELLIADLQVDAAPAGGRMDQAIAEVMPEAAGRSVAQVPMPEALKRVAMEGMVLLQQRTANEQLAQRLAVLAGVLSETPMTSIRSVLRPLLDTGTRSDLLAAVEQLALLDEQPLAEVVSRIDQQSAAPRPFVALSVDQRSLATAGSVRLSWSSLNADQCVASGQWSGAQALEGIQSVAVAEDSLFTLTCVGPGGVNTGRVIVDVLDDQGFPTVEAPPAATPGASEPPSGGTDPEPAPGGTAPDPGTGGSGPVADAPVVTLTSSEQSVSAGQNVRLTWSAENADSCTASGGWSGARALTGSESVGPLNGATTFTLSCSGPGGSSVAMTSVNLLATLTLSWQPPTENVDGTPIDTLSGYNIYFGESPGAYANEHHVNGANATSASIPVTTGTYYIAMTAIDGAGVESGYSNEITKVVR